MKMTFSQNNIVKTLLFTLALTASACVVVDSDYSVRGGADRVPSPEAGSGGGASASSTRASATASSSSTGAAPSAPLDPYHDLDDASQWSTVDMSSVGADSSGFSSAAFDGRYVYLVPGGDA